MTQISNEEQIQSIISHTLKLLTDPTISLSDILSPELTEALCVKKNNLLMLEFKSRIEHELSMIPSYEEALPQLNAKIDNLLAFIAYTEPQTNSKILIPTQIEDKFEMLEYTVEVLTLTSNYFSSPYKCYGLTSPSNSLGKSRILFMGTTFPTADGFAQALLADTAPGGGVGYLLYQQGKNILQRWVDRQHNLTGKPVHCCGQSLGGAMSMQTYIHQPTKISFTAINPPFLTNAESRIFNNSTATYDELIKENQIYSHKLDPISLIGHWLPTTTTVYIHGQKNDFNGSWLHKLFKAHAAQLSTQKFSNFSGQDYLRNLRLESNRMTIHYFLKIIRPLAFSTFIAGMGFNLIYQIASGTYNSSSLLTNQPNDASAEESEEEANNSNEQELSLSK